MSTPHIQLSLDEVRSVVEGFGLTLSRCERVRKVFKITTSHHRIFALKPTRLTDDDLHFIQDALLHLANVGFSVLPFISDGMGNVSIPVRSNRFLLLPWFDGREADFNRMGELMFGIKLLARLHQSGGFHPDFIPQDRFLWGLWPERFATRFHQLFEFQQSAAQKEQIFDRLYRRHATQYLRQAESAIEYLKLSPYTSVAAIERPHAYLCHHDFSDRNLLLRSDQWCLLDFDYCLCDLRLHDLANLLLRILRHDDWRPERPRFVLQVYHRQFPLTPNHLMVLHAFLNWPQDYWQVGLQYYVEHQDWPEARFMKSLRRSIDSESARQRFLRQFPEENGIARFIPLQPYIHETKPSFSVQRLRRKGNGR